MRAALFACLLAGCAQGRSNGGTVDANDEPTGGRVDARDQQDDADNGPKPDAAIDAAVDAPPAVTPDAMVTPDAPPAVTPDAMPDAPPSATPDAHVVVCADQQLLANPVLDLNPAGTMWVDDPIDSAYPIVTGDGNPTEDTAPYKAWLGGFIGDDFGVNTLTDELHQDVTIPANTMTLRLTAKYAVGSDEITSGAYDTAQLAITQTNGTPIQVIKSLSNLSTTSGWVAIDQTITPDLSGQTVRLRITSSNDYDGATSFFFDSFQLIATVCQ